MLDSMFLYLPLGNSGKKNFRVKKKINIDLCLYWKKLSE